MARLQESVKILYFGVPVRRFERRRKLHSMNPLTTLSLIDRATDQITRSVRKFGTVQSQLQPINDFTVVSVMGLRRIFQGYAQAHFTENAKTKGE